MDKNIKINRTNYAEYALEYIEGTLTEAQAQEFGVFLDENPDIAEQIAFLAEDMPVATADTNIVFEDKQSLMRSNKLNLRRAAAWCGGVAAAVAIVLAVGVLLRNGGLSEEVIPGSIMTAKADSLPAQITDTIINRSGSIFADTRAAKVSDKKTDTRPIAEPPVRETKQKVDVTANVETINRQDNAIDVADIMQDIYDVSADTQFELLAAVETGGALSRNDNVSSADNNGKQFKETVGGKFLRGMISRLTSPIGELIPVEVYTNNDERVVEVASFTVSRKPHYEK